MSSASKTQHKPIDLLIALNRWNADAMFTKPHPKLQTFTYQYIILNMYIVKQTLFFFTDSSHKM